MLKWQKILTLIVFTFALATNAHTETLEDILNPKEIDKLCNNFARNYMQLQKFYSTNGMNDKLENLDDRLMNDDSHQGELDLLYGIIENNNQKSIKGLQKYIFYRTMLLNNIEGGSKEAAKLIEVTKNVALGPLKKITNFAIEHNVITGNTEETEKILKKFIKQNDLCAKK